MLEYWAYLCIGAQAMLLEGQIVGLSWRGERFPFGVSSSDELMKALPPFHLEGRA